MSATQSVAKQSLTKSSLSLYKTLQLHRPLPTSHGRVAASRRRESTEEEVTDQHFEDAQREAHQNDFSSGEDSDQENQHTTRRSGSGSGRNKHRSSNSAGVFSSRQLTNQEPGGHEIEMSPRRTKNSVAAAQGSQRAETEPEKKKKRAPAKRKAESESESEEEEIDEEAIKERVEFKRLRNEVYRLEKEKQLAIKNKFGHKKKAAPGTESAEARETATQVKFWLFKRVKFLADDNQCCLLYTSPSPRDGLLSRMPSSA